MKVTVVTIEHKYGVNVLAFESEDSAIQYLADWARDNWKDVEDYIGPYVEGDRTEIIENYFMHHDNESYVIDTVEVQP